MRANTQGVCGSRTAIRLNYSSLLLLPIIKPVSRELKPCWPPLQWIQKQKKLSICPLATSLKDVTWAERKHQASQRAVKARKRVGVTQRSCPQQMCWEPGAARGGERASSCKCLHSAPQQLEHNSSMILNGKWSGHKSTTYYFSYLLQPAPSLPNPAIWVT